MTSRTPSLATPKQQLASTVKQEPSNRSLPKPMKKAAAKVETATGKQATKAVTKVLDHSTIPSTAKTLNGAVNKAIEDQLSIAHTSSANAKTHCHSRANPQQESTQPLKRTGSRKSPKALDTSPFQWQARSDNPSPQEATQLHQSSQQQQPEQEQPEQPEQPMFTGQSNVLEQFQTQEHNIKRAHKMLTIRPTDTHSRTRSHRCAK